MPESYNVPWYRTSTRTMGNPFSSLGQSWCPRCEMEVECDTQSSHRNEQFVWSKRCPRCGKVISWGVYQNVKLIELTDVPKQIKAIEFVTKPGADRRGSVKGRRSL